MSRGILERGDIVRGDFVLGGYCPGGYCPGDIVRGDIVRGNIVLEPSGTVTGPGNVNTYWWSPSYASAMRLMISGVKTPGLMLSVSIALCPPSLYLGRLCWSYQSLQ